MTRTLLLRLAGPGQAWDSRRARAAGDGQPTRGAATAVLHPTRTGLAGLCACALGRDRDTDHSDLLALDMVVRLDQPGVADREFRTVRRRTTSRAVVTVPMVDTVVWDGAFIAGLTGRADLVHDIAAALVQPRWPLFLGRREFPPTLPLLLGCVDAPAEDAVRAHPWAAHATWQDRQHARAVALRIVRLPASGNPSLWDDLDPVWVDTPHGSGPPIHDPMALL